MPLSYIYIYIYIYIVYIYIHICMYAESFQLCNSADHCLRGSSIHEASRRNTGAGCLALLQEIFLTQGLNPSFLHLLYCVCVCINVYILRMLKMLFISKKLISPNKYAFMDLLVGLGGLYTNVTSLFLVYKWHRHFSCT